MKRFLYIIILSLITVLLITLVNYFTEEEESPNEISNNEIDLRKDKKPITLVGKTTAKNIKSPKFRQPQKQSSTKRATRFESRSGA